MLPKRKRHACMLVSAGAAPRRLRESREVLAWLPRLRMLEHAKKLKPSLVCLTASSACSAECFFGSDLHNKECCAQQQALARMQSL